MADSLLLDGVDDYIRFSPGIASMGVIDSAEFYTIAVVAKLVADEAAFKNFVGLNAIDSIFGTNNSSPHNLTVFVGSGGSASAGSFTIPASDGWCIYAYSNDGTTTPRFHKYVFGTDTWTHAASTSGGIPEAVALTNIWFGRTGDNQSYMDANFLIAGWWNETLDDTAIEALESGYEAWILSSPAEVWRFNTLDSFGASGLSVESARVGTTLDTGDAPATWNDTRTILDSTFMVATVANAIDDVDRINWTNPGNAVTDDGNSASVTLTTGQSSEFIAALHEDGGLVPAGATISGIEVLFDRNFDGSQLGLNVYLTKDGINLASSGKSADSGTGLTVVGGPNDLWGTTWTVAEVNAATFGAEFAYGAGANGTGTVDAVWVKVYYTEAETEAGGVRIQSLGWLGG